MLILLPRRVEVMGAERVAASDNAVSRTEADAASRDCARLLQMKRRSTDRKRAILGRGSFFSVIAGTNMLKHRHQPPIIFYVARCHDDLSWFLSVDTSMQGANENRTTDSGPHVAGKPGNRLSLVKTPTE
jgi:hypothetical protein